MCEGVERLVELVCEMGRPVQWPMTISLAPMYSLCRERLAKSEVTWWDALLSSNQLGLVMVSAVATWAWGRKGGGERGCHWLVGGGSGIAN